MIRERPRKVLVALVVIVSCLLLVMIWHIQKPPSLLKTSNPSLKFVNEAKFSDEFNKDSIDDQGKFHLVTNIVLVTHTKYSENVLYDNKRSPTMEELIDRQNEIEFCLQSNLNHPKVASLHVVYTYPAQLHYLQKLKMINKYKLVLHRNQREPHLIDNLDYARKYLNNTYVILINQDNYLGEGFEDIDFIQLRKQKLMYALTRHQNSACGLYATCNEGASYQGSHDVFVFYSNLSFSSSMATELDILPSAPGNENLLIWYFQNEMKFKVTNPCKKLKSYHLHCVPIRGKGKKRVSTNGKIGLAVFTDILF